MGIKTKFCSMGRTSAPEQDLGNLSLWRYSNDVIVGKTLLYNYTGSDWGGNPHPYLYAYDCTFGTSGTFYVDSFPTSSGSTIYYSNYSSAASLVGNVSSVYNQNYFSSTMRTVGEAYEFNRNITADIPSSDGGALYVPKAKGKTIINDWYETTSSGTTEINRNTPFYNNQNVINVDLQNVPFRNNNMRYAFNNCRNLVIVNNISSSVASMYYTFNFCINLNQNIQIPNSVTSMAYTFSYCYNLKQNIKIPSSVTNMRQTFSYCYNLDQNIQIPNSVTNMSATFYYCYNLNQNIQIPDSISSVAHTFFYCRNFNQNIKIPDSVTSMQATFYSCSNLNQNIWIPNNATNISSTFQSCSNLNQNIRIPDSVTNMYATFSACSNLNQNIQLPNSVINMQATFSSCYNLNQNIKIGNSATTMYNTFRYCSNLNQNIRIPDSVTNMGYTFANCYNLNQNIQIPSSVTNMGYTFYVCYNYKQNISNLCNSRTSLTNAYNAFTSTKITNASHCFAGCTSLTNADAFSGCTSLTDISFTFERTAINQSIAIPASVTNMHGAFYYATALNTPITIPNGVVDMTYCFNGCSSYSPATLPSLSTSAKYAAYCFAGCSKLAVDLSNYCNGHTALTNIYYCFASSGVVNGVNAFANISTSIYASHCFDNCRSLTNIQNTLAHCANLTTAENCFNNCTGLKDVGFCIFESNKFTGNICFHATGITAANKIFSNNNSTRKNVYIYFTYANGVKTTTWNTFSTALWYYANGKANAKAKNILTNRRNCYVYNLGAAPEAGCILPDTKILMADGNTKDVQDIVITDLIQAYNQETGEFEPCRVTDVIPSWKSDILKIIMEDDTYIELTSGHSMLSERGWVACKPENVVKKDVNIEVSKLSIGDKILTKDGTYKVVKGIEEENLGLTRVYDLSIDKTHTYIANDLVQHNVISGSGS